MEKDLKQIISNFKLKSAFVSAKPVSTGHINDTFIINTENPNLRYILQRINHNIFKNVEGLSNNILLVTKHIAKKIDLNLTDGLLTKKLELIETTDGKYFHKDSNGSYWRVYNFIEDSISYEMIDNPEKAYKAGKAFGKFQSLLSDLSSNSLVETIPNFHNMKTRHKTFLQNVEKNPVNRVNSVEKEINFVKSHIEEMIGMQQLIDDGKIPVRITHNDTKINNILFDKNDIPVCIVDLDTVMPGSVLYDFGDAIRTAASTVEEDEKDLSKVSMNISIYEAYTKGYIEAAKSFLNKTEKDNLALSAKYITFIMGLRFLTDYIDGDNYYKIAFPEHNIQRARNQFKLVESMDSQFARMKEIVSKF